MNSKDGKIYCKTGGCGAKLGPAALRHILGKVQQPKDPNLLVGFDNADDAAVYKINNNTAIVQTLDFFPPMVEDPYTFGQIAATNALSDIYAMGGVVKTALNIVCFPQDEDLNILGKIIEGGTDKVNEAGGSLVGGHSINDTSIKYGLSVMGTIHPDKVYMNNNAKPGDCLILTKPLGVGIVCSANNVGHASKSAMKKAIKSMTTLNKAGADLCNQFKVNACTDVTGFGLISHLLEMLEAKNTQNFLQNSLKTPSQSSVSQFTPLQPIPQDNNVYAKLYVDKIPYIEEAYDYANDFYITAAGQRNRNFAGNKVNIQINDFAMEELIFDPQTSGGLLFSVDKHDASSFLKALQKFYPQASIIGEIFENKYGKNNLPEKIIVSQKQ